MSREEERSIRPARWQARTLELLLEAKACGETDFAKAWRRAQRLAAAEGVFKPKDRRRPPDEGPDWQPASTFWRHACEREWNGLVDVDYAGLRELLDPKDRPQTVGRGRARGSRVRLR